MRRLLAMLTMFALYAPANAETQVDFDYYVLSLTWVPNWCAEHGEREGSELCDPGQRQTWALEGFRPSYQTGEPSYCLNNAVAPSREDAERMTDIMRDDNWAWHQWKKHGSCSGLEGEAYFETARRAFDSIMSPPSLNHIDREVQVPIQAIQDTMLQINPYLRREGMAVTCTNGRMQELQICLNRDLIPTDCEPLLRGGCSTEVVQIAPPL